MKYCTHCGKELMDEAVICPGCGCPVSGIHLHNETSQERTHNQVLLAQLKRKIKTEIQLWTWIAISQAVISLILFVNAHDGEFFIGLPISLFVIAIVNFSAVLNLKNFLKSLNNTPCGIVKRYEPFYRYAFNFIYNLIFGGVIGVAGSIYGIMTRNFVLKNEPAFLELERMQTTNIT